MALQTVVRFLRADQGDLMDSNIGYLSGRECFYELVGNEAATLRFASLRQHNTNALCDHPRRREKNYGSDAHVRRFAGPDLMKNKTGLNLAAVGEAAERTPICFEVKKDGIVLLWVSSAPVYERWVGVERFADLTQQILWPTKRIRLVFDKCFVTPSKVWRIVTETQIDGPESSIRRYSTQREGARPVLFFWSQQVRDGTEVLQCEADQRAGITVVSIRSKGDGIHHLGVRLYHGLCGREGLRECHHL